MYVVTSSGGCREPRRAHGFTLPEVLMCVVVAMVAFSGIIYGFVQSSYRAEWSGYSLAAQALAVQTMEQARSAKWDLIDNPPVNEITNMTSPVVTMLDLPVSGTNKVYATNFLTITNIPCGSNTSVYMVRVDTVWQFTWKTPRLYTNTIVNYYAQD